MDVFAGSTDVTTYFALRLAATGVEATGLLPADIDLQYTRSGEVPTAKVDAVALAATNTAHTDNRAIEIDATDQPGLYRVDWPDAAFAAGAREAVLTVKVATAFTEHLRVNLTPVAANATHFGGTAGTFVGGRPTVDVLRVDGQMVPNNGPISPVVRPGSYIYLDIIASQGPDEQSLDLDIWEVRNGVSTNVLNDPAYDFAYVSAEDLVFGSLINFKLKIPATHTPGDHVKYILRAADGTLDFKKTFGPFTVVQWPATALPNAAAAAASGVAVVGSAMTIATNGIVAASLAADCITDAKIAVPAETSGRPSRVLAMMRRLWEGRHNKRARNRTTGAKVIRNAADSGDLETSTQSTAASVDTETKGT